MMNPKQVMLRAGLVLIMAGAVLSSGCASSYMRNRGNDFLDMFDGGITTSKSPRVSVYVGYFNFLTIGFSNFDGTLHGVAGRQSGKFPARHHATGLLLWGHEEIGYSAPGTETVENPDSYAVGPLGLAMGPRAPFRQRMSSPKLLHLGWVGVALNCHWPQIADFALGWFGVDILNDDTAGPAASDPAAVAAVSAGAR